MAIPYRHYREPTVRDSPSRLPRSRLQSPAAAPDPPLQRQRQAHGQLDANYRNLLHTPVCSLQLPQNTHHLQSSRLLRRTAAAQGTEPAVKGNNWGLLLVLSLTSWPLAKNKQINKLTFTVKGCITTFRSRTDRVHDGKIISTVQRRFVVGEIT